MHASWCRVACYAALAMCLALSSAACAAATDAPTCSSARELALEAASGALQPRASDLRCVAQTSALAAGPSGAPTGKLPHGALIRELTLNRRRVEFPGGGGLPQVPAWHANHTLPTRSLLAAIRLRTHLPQAVRSDSVGAIALRHHTSSADAVVLSMQRDPEWLWVYVDFDQVGSTLSPPLPGAYAVTLRLRNSHLQEPLVLRLGDVHLAHGVAPFQLADVWDGSLLDKFVRRCAADPAFEAQLASRMVWGEALVSLFSVSYSAAVAWLGPFDFTAWQRRAYQLSCVAGLGFQLVFVGWCADALAVRLAFPLACALALLYFGAFNATNVLILLERDDAFPELELAAVSPPQQRATHLALLHAKRARWY